MAQTHWRKENTIKSPNSPYPLIPFATRLDLKVSACWHPLPTPHPALTLLSQKPGKVSVHTFMWERKPPTALAPSTQSQPSTLWGYGLCRDKPMPQHTLKALNVFRVQYSPGWETHLQHQVTALKELWVLVAALTVRFFILELWFSAGWRMWWD